MRILPSPAIASVAGPMTMSTPGWTSGIAGLADAGDLAVLDADVGLDDAPVVDDQRVGDDGVDGAFAARELRLAHAVADDLAAAELHLLAIGGEVLLDLDDEVGVGEADLVADGRAEHVGIGVAGNPVGHGLSLSCGWRGNRRRGGNEAGAGFPGCAMMGETMNRTKGFTMTRLRVVLAAVGLICGLGWRCCRLRPARATTGRSAT